MAGNVCPTCNSSIDPARAPVARIRGAKVVTFCAGAGERAADKPDERIDERIDERDRVPDPVHRDESSPYDAIELRPRSGRKRQIIALSAAIMAGGMLLTVINAVSPSSPSDVSAAKSKRSAADQDSDELSGAAGEAPDDDGDGAAAAGPGEPESLAPERLFARAGAVLQELLESPSPRVKRIAAMALSRTGDPGAVAYLAQLLDSADNNLWRIDAAYALARLGDPRGTNLLLSSLRHERRDVRVDAARALVRLGDDRGNKTLRRMLSLRTHRMGAAGLLARRGDREGLDALREVVASEESSDEDRMRALVALGRSGDAAVRDQLVAILEDGGYMVGAADALAVLGDAAVTAPLNRQLAIASLRVRAAVALRRLGADPDLRVLAAALDRGDDQARVSAAEAVLVLTGPRRVAEFD